MSFENPELKEKPKTQEKKENSEQKKEQEPWQDWHSEMSKKKLERWSEIGSYTVKIDSFVRQLESIKWEKDNTKKMYDLALVYVWVDSNQKQINNIAFKEPKVPTDNWELLDDKCDDLKKEIMSNVEDKEKFNAMLSELFGKISNKDFLKYTAKDQRLEKITKPPKEAKDVKSWDDIRFTFTFENKLNENLYLKTTAGQVLPSEVRQVEIDWVKYSRESIWWEFFTTNNERLTIHEWTQIKIWKVWTSEEIIKMSKENDLKVAEYLKNNQGADPKIVTESINRWIDPKIALTAFWDLVKNTPKEDVSSVLEDAFTEYDRMRDYNNVSSKEQTWPNFITLILDLLMKFTSGNWKELAKTKLNIDDNSLKNHESSVVSNNERSEKIRSFNNLDENKPFIENATIISKEIEKVYWIPWKITVSQAALESNWWKSKLSTQWNNYFWIKSFWKWPSVNFNTNEVVNWKQVTVNDWFKTFWDMKDSFIGYANFLTKNKRYKEAFNYWSDINPKPEYYGSNYQWYDSDKFAYEIAKAWYATDPNYYQKIVSISRKLDSNIA